MVIWINGPFGSGKTTVARELRKALPSTVIFDPEIIGITMQWATLNRRGDFQEIRAWRSLTGLVVRVMHKTLRGNVIVPMTVLNPSYFKEIIAGISYRNLIRHFFLNIDGETLRAKPDAWRYDFPRCNKRR